MRQFLRRFTDLVKSQLPKGGTGDTTQHTGIHGGGEGAVLKVLEEDQGKDTG